MTSKIANPHQKAGPVRIPLGDIALQGYLEIPECALGLVIFVHGSGSSRFSARNMHVAAELNQHGLATLLLDLLTHEEQKIDSETMEFRFDIPLLAARSTAAAKWALDHPETSHLPIGLFGASTGTAAALIAASVMKDHIAAVVSRGGRPDLAEEALDEIVSPTLLIVGGADHAVLTINKQALLRIPAVSQMHIVPGATHLFEEPGTMEQVARAATEWFVKYLQSTRAKKTVVA